MRFKQFSHRTESSYWHWIKGFILFHGKRHPRELHAAEVQAYLSHLAAEKNVAAATQNQALNALVFLYREVLSVELGALGQIERPTRSRKLPTVLTKEEVQRVLAAVSPEHQLTCRLLYGTGMRLLECLPPLHFVAATSSTACQMNSMNCPKPFTLMRSSLPCMPVTSLSPYTVPTP